FQWAMDPKPYLKKGTGKYTKINYPVLRRSGVYQPPADPPLQQLQQHYSPSQARPQLQQQRPLQHVQQRRSPPRTEERWERNRQLPYSIPPLQLPLPGETGVLGQRTPSMVSELDEEEYSRRSSNSAPHGATTAVGFGSSGDSRRTRGESDEGVGMMRDGYSPGIPSGRPRTAGTVDSGFPREDPPLSPLSSSSETNASSIPSMVVDITNVGGQMGVLNMNGSAGPSSRRSSPTTSPTPTRAAPAAAA
ncbi:hypothetical protein PFISCL1PPCAC_9467, partial [Pristionchus fissidentatus]